MALIKQNTTQVLPTTTTGVIAEQAVAAAVWDEPTPQAVYEAPVEQETFHAVQASTPVASASSTLTELSNQGFEGLVLDWTSFPGISLKTEGVFVDIDGKDYGKEFNCRLSGSKQRWVYRASPVLDNKRDVAFSYDRVTTQNGILIEDKKREWTAQGKIVEEKEYLEVLVEMVAEGEAYDGEYRILSVSPTSKGRFSGHVAKCAALGGGDPGQVITKVLVGAKITKVQNPFYPWAFEIVK